MQVFSAFGFVHKITTFEKTAGFQALVQFSDAETASSAKNALDGRCIPSYLLPEQMGPCTLRITYSAHTDLSVKFQSHRSRDYTNPYLPVAQSAIDGSGQLAVGVDGKKLEPESNVLLASIENMQYAVTLDVLHMPSRLQTPISVPSPFRSCGNPRFENCTELGLQNLEGHRILCRLVSDIQTAVVAKESLEGHCIYDGGFCKLHLSYSRHTDLSIKVNNDRSRDYTLQNPAMANTQPSILGQQPGPATSQYGGPGQYPPVSGQTMMQQPTAGWGPVPGGPQSMPMQMQSNPYMSQAPGPYQMGPGMMQGPSPGGLPPHHATGRPPYGGPGPAQ
ncbi:hypothetical protein CRG98_027545 [Punica granatum]|uniref:PTBP1-like RNA recognition motif 2 domain-containing protein n=1 Tax=Punica granatum TaxID=22663 RepID=A0A2I0J7B4_PUNGR|nr:hypothetical protein CRG98_027545 [Punica granatum]